MLSVLCRNGDEELVFTGKDSNDIADAMRQSKMGAMSLHVYLQFLLLRVTRVYAGDNELMYEVTSMEEPECCVPETSSD